MGVHVANCWRTLVVGMVCLGVSAAGPRIVLGGTVTGCFWVPKVKGCPWMGHVYLCDWGVFLSRQGPGGGQGLPAGFPPTWPCSYSFTAPAGIYSLFLDQPMLWGRPVVLPNVEIPWDGTITRDIEPPTDYSCLFESSDEWGPDPWTVDGNVWYQTFPATGTSVTGVVFRLSATQAPLLEVSICQDNGGPVPAWPRVSPPRWIAGVSADEDVWLRWPSNTIPTVPGRHYALKLAGFAPFRPYRRIDNGMACPPGQAFDGAGVGQSFDLYGIIFTDSDGTLVSYCSTQRDEGAPAGEATVWSQEIRPMGGGLAGVSLLFATETWDESITFRVRSGGPDGPPIGPAKQAQGVYAGPDSGMAGASWNPCELPWMPGQVYYVEASRSGGLNPFRFTLNENRYAAGDAFMNGVRQPGVDLYMQVLEYAPGTPPGSACLEVDPVSFARSVLRGHNLPSESFTIHNTCCSTVCYTVSDDVQWMGCSPSAGCLLPDQTDVITVTFDTASLPAGVYTGTIFVNSSTGSGMPLTIAVTLTVKPTPGDFDQDGDVDQEDFGRFQVCLTGAGIEQPDPACARAKLDEDVDVDIDDLGIFQDCMSGPNVMADPNCPS